MRNIKEYFKPATIQKAVRLLREHPGKGQIIAGGTRVAAEKDPALEYLVDITYCGLDHIRKEDGQIRIGACVTLEDLNESDVIKDFAKGVIAEVARWTGSIQLRNSATVGGSILSGADIALPFLALEAQMTVVGDTERQISLAELYNTPGKILKHSELIQELVLPSEFRHATASALRMSRTRQDVSLVAVAAVMLCQNDLCQKARLAVAPVVSGITRIPEVEGLLEGKRITDDLIDNAAVTVAQAIEPVNDFRASAEYRRKMIRVYTKRVLSAC